MEVYQELEQTLAHWSGIKGIVVCSSGTASLHLALEALQLPTGSSVLVPDYTMIACARAVTMAGLKPVFCDCTSNTLLIDPDEIDRICSEQDIRAVMAVHVYGRRCDMESIHALARKYELTVIEDLAEGHGIVPHPDTVASCWSFFRNKIIAGEEGAAVAFRAPYQASFAKALRCMGFTDAHDYTHIPRGWNHRLSNANAALILSSLRDYPANVLGRRFIEGWYDRGCPPEWRMPERDVVWVYDLRIPGLKRETQTRVVQALKQVGIAARCGFKVMSGQEEYRGKDSGRNSTRAQDEVFYLPIQPGVTTRESCSLAFETIRRSLAAET